MERCPPKPSKPPSAANLNPLSRDEAKGQSRLSARPQKGGHPKAHSAHLNPERLLKVAQIAATTTPKLVECDIASLIGAIGQCAQMGLEPNTVLGHAYLVPFNTRRKNAAGGERWVDSVQVIIG